MRAIVRLLVVVLAGSGNALAQPKDAAYYCIGEAAGGLKYNEVMKEWDGTSLWPARKFVLKLIVREPRRGDTARTR